MDNQQLKVRFDELNNRIEEAKQNGLDTKPLLREKYEMLKIGYARIKRETFDEKYNENPKKYSTLLSYLNTMKDVANEAGMSLIEVLALEKDVKEEMKKNNIDWLLDNQI